MKSVKKQVACICFIIMSLFVVQPTFAAITPDVWTIVNLNQIEVGQVSGTEQVRIRCTAINGSFSHKWIAVDTAATNIVAAAALTAHSLGQDVRILIENDSGTFEITSLRIVTE